MFQVNSQVRQWHWKLQSASTCSTALAKVGIQGLYSVAVGTNLEQSTQSQRGRQWIAKQLPARPHAPAVASRDWNVSASMPGLLL